MCSNSYFGGFTGGGHFWRVTPRSTLILRHTDNLSVHILLVQSIEYGDTETYIIQNIEVGRGHALLNFIVL